MMSGSSLSFLLTDFADEAVDRLHHPANRTHLDLDVGQHELRIARRVLQEGQQIPTEVPALRDLDRRGTQPVIERRLRAGRLNRI